MMASQTLDWIPASLTVTDYYAPDFISFSKIMDSENVHWIILVCINLNRYEFTRSYKIV